MKKHIFTVSAFIIASFLIVAACSKEDSKQAELMLEKNEYTECSNPNNAYDSAGFLHNYYLQEMYDDNIFNIGTVRILSSEDVDVWLHDHSSYLEKYNVDVISFAEIYNSFQNSSNNLYWGFIDGLDMTNESKSNIKSMIGGVIDIFLNTGSWNYDLYYDYITSEEERIMESQFYSSEESQKELREVLSFASILRYSLFYWTNTGNMKKADGKGPGTWGIIIADAAFGLVSLNFGVAALASGLATWGAVANGDITIEKNDDGGYTVSPTDSEDNDGSEDN